MDVQFNPKLSKNNIYETFYKSRSISHQYGIEASKEVSSQGEEKKAAKDLENAIKES